MASEATIWSSEVGSECAPLIALVHGSMDRSTGMLKLSRQLDSRFRVLRYDRRGYGRSVDQDGTHPGPFDMASQVEDLARLLGGRRALLVGHSYGGNVALTLGAQQPQLVAAIVVYESPMSWEPWWPGTTGGGAALAAGRDGGRAAEVFMRGLVGDAAWDRLPERTRDKRRAEGEAMLGELSDLRRNRPWIASEITCPVMIGRGTNGRPHHQDGARQLHEQISGSQLVTLDGCRHDAPLSHPQLFTEQLIEPMVSYLEA